MLPDAVASGAETRNLGFGTLHAHGHVGGWPAPHLRAAQQDLWAL
jgi:hypothetical protein